jgi:peptidoglycan/LPS O-acetylase OafA/YrhL
MIAFAYRGGLRLPKQVAVLSMMAGLGTIIAMSFQDADPFRFIFWGCTSALIVTGAVMLPNPDRGTSSFWRIAVFLGDAS